MKDPLKTFIEEHRAAFDSETPNEGLFQRMAGKLQHVSRKTVVIQIPTWVRFVAAACGIVFITYIGLQWTDELLRVGSDDLTQSQGKVQPDPLLQGIDPGSAREMQRMATEASVRESGLALLRKDDPELYQRFLRDLSELDSVYHSLREMLTRTPNHQQLIEAMEENLQMRLQLLERQHDIIQDIKRNKNSRS
jgi:hypothetical protein